MKTYSTGFITLFIIVILSLNSSIEDSTQNSSSYYYSCDKKIPLTFKENTLLVKFTDNFNKEYAEQSLKDLFPGIKIIWRKSLVAEIIAGSEKQKNEIFSALKAKDDVYTCQPFYTQIGGGDAGVTDEIIIKFLPELSKEKRTEALNSYSLVIIRPGIRRDIVRVPKGADALSIANKIYESELVEYCHPNFIVTISLAQDLPNDQYFNKQITCHNTGQIFTDGHSGTFDADIDAPEAWDWISDSSSDIVVAVIDVGVTSNHGDLPNIRQVRLNGSNFGSGDENDPSPQGNDYHGDACAGVIAATKNNAQGIAGIASSCEIMPIRWDSTSDIGDMADAIEFAAINGADIISNSWGLETFGAVSPNLYEDIVDAIQFAVEDGRNGLGCVVLFAAGNTADHNDNDYGYITFPANVDINGVITVGASDRYDYQANYSPTSVPAHPYNQIIDIVAPSNRALPGQISGEDYEMWTIDIPGNAGRNIVYDDLPDWGYNYLAYTGRFGGTSHSCPVVAGVAALMLSMNPDLTYMQVFDTLMSTADKVGGYTYTNGRCNQMGYGRVNAYRAVSAITGGPISGDRLICTSPNKTFTYNNRPSGTTITWTKSSNLEYVSGQGTNNYTVRAYGWASGPGWGKATLNSSDEGLKYEVWVGPPALEVTGPDEGYTYNTYTFYADPIGPYSNSSNYNWVLNPLYGNHVYNYGDYADIAFYDPYEGYQVLSRAQNTCGTGDYAVWNIYIYNYWEEYSLYPNPASDIVTITVKRIASPNNGMIVDINANDINTIYTIRIFDFYGVLHYSTTKSGNIFSVPVSNLKDGNYIVQINNGKKLSNLHLVIKHH